MELQNSPLPLIFSFLIFVFMVFKLSVFTQNQATKLPPGPWRLPIIGNLHQLIGSSPHIYLRDLANKHGSLMHLRLGQLSTIVVSSPAVAMEIMKTHDLNFADRPSLLGAEIVFNGSTDVVFAPYGNYWRQLRKICMLELLSAKRVESFRHIREEEVSNLIQSISNSVCSPVNFTEKFLSLINNIVGRAVFGKKCKDQEAFLQILKEALKLFSGFDLGDIFPSLKFVRVITGMKFRLEHIHQKFDRILDDIVEAHKAEKTEDKTEEDLVDVLLRIQKNGDLEFPLTTNNIKSVLLDMFAAGTETSSTTMGWAMAELMRNPTVMEKAQVEVRQVLGGKSKFDESDTNKLHYLKSVLKETLRLHPPLPLLLPRECREKCIIEGYDIPIKTRVLINAWAIGRDPKYWDDAEIFKPERFDGSEIDFKGCNFEFIPFGAGRRICPGMSMGLANSLLPLAQLLYYYDWKLPNSKKPEELDMEEAFGVTMGRKSDLYLIPIPHFS